MKHPARFSNIVALITGSVFAGDRVERVPIGPSESLVEHVVEQQSVNGQSVSATNRYVEIANGLNFFDGQWTTTEPNIVLDKGFAKAWKGQHKVTFSADLNAGGSVLVRLPSGDLFSGQVYGLALFNVRTGESLVFATVKNSQGWLTESGEILYLDAFNGISADVRYTYSRSNLEQDVILREAPNIPYHWNAADARLEVWSEIGTDRPPKNTKSTRNDRDKAPGQHVEEDDDEEIDFGSMHLAPGRAFVVAHEDVSLTMVRKQWQTTPDGRTFLIEAVPVEAIAPALEALPRAKKNEGASRNQPLNSRLQAFKSLPAKGPQPDRATAFRFRPANSEGMVASVQPGIVLDYQLALSSAQTNYVFRGDTTYNILGPVDLYGNTVLEGGAVLKYAASGGPLLNVQGTLTCQTSGSRPAVFTAKDDDTVGEKIALSTGAPGNSAYASYALKFLNSAVGHRVEHIRIRNAANGIAFSGSLSNTVFNAQFVRCQFPISSTGIGAVGIYNLLVDAGLATGHVFSGATTTPFTAEHATINNCPSLLSACTLTARNSILAAITSVPPYSGAGNFQSSTSSGLFQSALAGNFYLAAGSSQRDAGVIGIDTSLATELKRLTTYPPIEIRQNISSSMTLSPQAGRDSDLPDRGYHYFPIDYHLSGRTLSGATLTLTNGVSIAAYGNIGLTLGNGASLVSEGRPNQMNRLIRYQNIQEQPILFGTTLGSGWLDISALHGTRPGITMRFTEVSTMGESVGARTLLSTTVHYLSSANIRDCQFGGSSFRLGEGSGGTAYSIYIDMNNNLSDRGEFYFSRYYYSGDTYLVVNLWNNLFRRGTLTLNADNIGYNPIWTVRDNAFDNLTISQTGTGLAYITNSHNAYINTGVISMGNGGNNVSLSTFIYSTTTGGLGRWYHGQANLLNVGFRTAASAGLYHSTTQTSLAKEATSLVDIGFHYISTDTSGTPLDADGDGVPDYLEDRNGNGNHDPASESNWNFYNSPNGLVGTPAVQVLTPLR